MPKISEEKDCEHLVEWIKPCGNLLMWSATSTPSGDGELIWARFESFLSTQTFQTPISTSVLTLKLFLTDAGSKKVCILRAGIMC